MSDSKGASPTEAVASGPGEALPDAGSQRLMRLATYASVGVAGLLIAVKLVAWILTDSVALLSTLVDSLLDLAASIVNLIAIRTALTPPDKEHRFGHGKAEPLAALGQSAFIAGSALFLLFEVGKRLITPRAIEQGEVGIWVMVFAILATFVLTRFQSYVVKKSRSLAIKADSLHYLGDLLVNVAVIVALLLSTELGWTLADPLFGLAIAIYILWTAWKIVRDAFSMLMDEELPDEARRRIKAIVQAHPEVRSLHDLRTRASGPVTFIQLHLEMDGALTLYRAHEVADQVEAEILAAFPGAEVMIHQDPYGLEEPPTRVGVARRG
ncbi:MAG: cation diffusion facilitator family transporter [Kiloniellales bacterium]